MLYGLSTGYLTLPHGVVGRTLLGRQATRVLGTPPVGADSLTKRLSPNAVAGDVLITSVWVAPGNYGLRVNQDGTYRYNAVGDGSRQTHTVDGYSIVLGALYGEGALTINDAPPQPAGGPGKTFFPNVVYTINQAVNVQLQATDPNGDVVTFAIHAGGLPTGLSMDSTGHVTGTTTAFGAFGVVIRISDSFGAFTDVTDIVTVSNSLPNFVNQLLSQATPAVTALGLTISTNTLPSASPINTILAQLPFPGTPIVPGGVIIFTLSDGSLSIGNPSVFPQNIKGLTWSGTRSYIWKTVVQPAITQKTTAFQWAQYPIIEWELTYELLDQNAAIDDLKKIAGLFNQSQGQTNTFLYEDSTFNSVTNFAFATGSGTTKQFQLTAGNNNLVGPGGLEVVQAVQPSPAIQIFDNGSLVSSANYTISALGVVTFTTAPAAGHVISWTGKFYYPCRFQQDDLDPNQFMQTFWSLQQLKFRSVIL